MKRYWHKLANSTVNNMFNRGATWGEVMERYKQPDWCGYPDALEGDMGCWSLVFPSTRRQISREYCKTCDRYIGDK